MTTDTKRRSIFDIGDDLRALEQLIERVDGDISDPAVDAAVTAWYAELESDLARKADGYVNLIRKWEAEATAAIAEAEQYRKAAQVREDRVRRLKQMLQSWMETRGRNRIETASGRVVAVQANGGKAPIVYADPNVRPETLAPRFVRVVEEINRDAIREALEAGEALGFATLGERGRSLRIR